MNAVVTYIFGENQEILREPLVVDPGVDYICVTDQPSLKSKHWRIIVDDIPQAKCTRDKMPLVKYNPFKYTDAQRILVIDGTLQITNTLKTVFNQLDTKSLAIKRHPERNNLIEELVAWRIMRQLSPRIIERFCAMSVLDGISLYDNFLVESCIIGYRNVSSIKYLCKCVLAYMSYLGENGTLCMTNQCPFTYCIKKSGIEYAEINQLSIAKRYRHGKWTLHNR
jgi:hypothetical protein